MTAQLSFLISLLILETISPRAVVQFEKLNFSSPDKMAYVQPAQLGNRGYGGEFHFLKIMAEEIEKGHTAGSTFRKEHQLCVYRKFRSIFGPLYSDRFLRSRFKLLKKRYHEFSELLNQKGILWNKKNNIVYGNEKLLSEKHKSRFKHGHYYGEHHFEFMCQIFESGVNFE